MYEIVSNLYQPEARNIDTIFKDISIIYYISKYRYTADIRVNISHLGLLTFTLKMGVQSLLLGVLWLLSEFATMQENSILFFHFTISAPGYIIHSIRG